MDSEPILKEIARALFECGLEGGHGRQCCCGLAGSAGDDARLRFHVSQNSRRTHFLRVRLPGGGSAL